MWDFKPKDWWDSLDPADEKPVTKAILIFGFITLFVVVAEIFN